MTAYINPKIIAPTRRGIQLKPDISIVLMTSSNHKMKSYGPKPLLKLFGNITLLEYQINTIKHVFPESDIILSIGEDSDKVLKHRPQNVRIVENQLYNDTNEVEYLRLSLNVCNTSKVLIINGDMFFDKNILRKFSNTNESCLMYDSSNKLDKNEIGITVSEGVATVFNYKLEKKWCNLILLKEKELDHFKNLCSDKNRRKQFLFELFNVVLDRKPIKAFEIPDGSRIYRISSFKDLEVIQNEVKNIDC